MIPDEFKIETTTGEMSIRELYEFFFGAQITPDPTPTDIRERILFLSDKYHLASMEKTVSNERHGRKQVGLWNNILEMIRREMDAVEIVNNSICNERRVVNYRT